MQGAGAPAREVAQGLCRAVQRYLRGLCCLRSRRCARGIAQRAWAEEKAEPSASTALSSGEAAPPSPAPAPWKKLGRRAAPSSAEPVLHAGARRSGEAPLRPPPAHGRERAMSDALAGRDDEKWGGGGRLASGETEDHAEDHADPAEKSVQSRSAKCSVVNIQQPTQRQLFL